MRNITSLIVALCAMGALSGCAAAAGQAAGTVVGGSAKGVLFAGKGAVKGAKFVGRVGYGAAKGVHEEFAKPSEPAYVAAAADVADKASN